MQLPEFKRDIVSIIANRLQEKRNFMQVIIGPRQVGKTTAINQALEVLGISCHYAAADLIGPPQPEWILQQWDLCRRKAQNGKSAILILDEVQKISRWSEEVKRLWDEDTRFGNNIKVVLLGSSALLVQKGLGESLAGRFEIIRAGHWSWKECRDCFKWGVDEYLYFGGYPGAAVLVNNEERWSQYIKDSLIETALSKDVLLLNRVEKPALLRQLFVLACEYSGQILSYQKLLGQLSDAGNTVTLAHYQKLLESAFLIRGLSKWSGGALRRRSSSPKWIPLNTALITALSNKGFAEWRNAPDMWGRLVEAAIGAYLINEGGIHNIEVYYWRKAQYEIDYVLRKADKLIGIEVKSGKRRISSPGLEVFSKNYKPLRNLIVGAGGIEIKEFFETPIAEWF